MERKGNKKVDEFIHAAAAVETEKSNKWQYVGEENDVKKSTSLNLYNHLWKRFKKVVEEQESKSASDLFNDFMKNYLGIK